jgi:hypothetical protein
VSFEPLRFFIGEHDVEDCPIPADATTSQYEDDWTVCPNDAWPPVRERWADMSEHLDSPRMALVKLVDVLAGDVNPKQVAKLSPIGKWDINSPEAIQVRQEAVHRHLALKRLEMPPQATKSKNRRKRRGC